jgi:cytochrome P450
MQMLSEMELPFLDVDSSEFHKNPFPFVDEVRKRHPWLARFSHGYVIHGYQAARDLAPRDEDLQLSFAQVVDFHRGRGTPWGEFMIDMLMTSPKAKHKRLRDSVAAGFTPRRANQIRPMIREILGRQLDAWVPKGAFDFADFAANYPVAVMCGLLGISAAPVAGLRQSLDDHMSSLTFKPDIWPKIEAAYREMESFTREVIAERERSGVVEEGSELDAFIGARRAGLMDDTELRFMLLTFIVAGYDTSKNMLAMIVHTLLDKPEMWERCAGDIGYCGKVVEEALRYAAIATLYREVIQEFDYDGIRFPKGITLTFAFPLTGRDPSAFPDPHRFDPERVSANRHSAFGRGSHICIGQYIARALLEEGLHIIAQRLARPRLTGEPAWRPFLGAWGFEKLPIAFDPAPARQAAAQAANA